MARAVEFTNVRIFTAETERMPNFVLHELAHAYHHRVLPDSFGNADVKAAHARATASGLYDAVERRNGSGKPVKTERAYALTTPQEFFAETTEAFFSRNDFFPYTKADLARHDPETTAMLVRLWGVAAEPAAGARPNIVILYADDMGYGDLGADNPASKIPTPHLDRLAAEGMRFTDAHSSSGICSPSRYALLTGRHHWRDFHGIVDSLGPSVFKPGQLTLPAMLRDQGYATACVGKWHLGWDWNAIRRPRTPPKSLEHGDFDWTKPIPDGPLAHGFDTYFGDDVINFPPYAWIENDRVVEAPDATLDKPAGRPKEGEWECRAGPARSDWDFYRVLPTLTGRAEDFVRSRQGNPQPFLLYFPLPSPHAPIIPNDEFDGRSRAGPFGDFVAQTDDACGRVLAALRETGLDANTIVVFTADNGAEQYAYARDAAFDHWSSGPFRGIKRDLYEGGHHVPFLLRWPGVTKPGSVSHALVSQVDLMATLAAGVGYDLPADAAADSHDLLPWLTGGVAEPPRTTIVHNTNPNRYAIRHGDWLLVDGETGVMEPKKRSAPAAWNEKHSYPPEDGQPVELYDLRKDVGQRHNLAAAHPEQVAELRGLLKQTRETERSAPAAASDAASDACRKPNVVFFLCDDLGTGDLGSLGSKDIRTPNIDGLFARGTRLSRHWSGSAVCAPSRCVLMTGKHPGHAVVRSNRQAKPEGQPPMPAGTVTLAKLFQDSGYATGGFGKWGLGAPGSWSDPIACGFDDFFGYNCQREAHSYYPDHLWSGRERVPLDGKSYSADLIAERQLAFIKANAGRPFFLYVPTTVPHLALQVPGDEPSLAHYEEHFGDESPYLGGRGYVPCRRPLATYAAMITRMDREVGRIVGLLDELKLADDTIFVFSSDNGAAQPGTGGIDTARLASNGMLRDWKGSPYEGGLRVPTVAVWPGVIRAGKSIDAPTGFEDWLPTLLDLAGLRGAIPAGLDGMSLAPALRGEAEPPQDRVLYRELTEGQWQAAVDGRWKAIRRAAGRMEPRQAAPTELYDLAADPSESKDLAVAHPDVVARLEAILDREHVADAAWPMPFAAARATPAPREQRPNILYIIVDDQSPFDFKVYNPASTLHSPVIERLATEGMVFDAAYHMGSFSGAVCVPSRHMVMSGRSVWHLPIGPGGKTCPPDIAERTIPAVFNRAGYDTMRTCKQENCYEAASAQFTLRHDATKRGGAVEAGSAWHADRVMDYLAERERTRDADPFFIYLGFSHPHDTRDGTPELLANYGSTNHTDRTSPPAADPRQPPLPPNWLRKHPFDNSHLDVRDEVAVSGVWDRRDERTIRNELGREYACSENIDRQIGRVLDTLEAMGELENTWIFYTSDHGIAIGRHGLQGKQNLYEHTWRVPFIVKGPGVKPGTRVPGYIYLGDSLATLCDICGISPPETNEGKSFLPVLEGKTQAVRDVLYGVYCGGRKPGIRSVRLGDWKLIKYESPEGGLHTQLFNLADNPHELLAEHHDPAVASSLPAPPAGHQKNLADDPAHAAKRAEMEALLLAEMQRHDDPFRFSDQPRKDAVP